MRGTARLPEMTGRWGACACAIFWLWMGPSAPIKAQTPLALPSAMAFDAQGNLYFAETNNHVVRKISVGGGLTTVAGNSVQGFAGDGGPAAAAELDSPAGLAVDATGNLYIADSHNHRVRLVTAATGVVTTIAGSGVAGYSGDGGLAVAARLALPTALALDAAGNVYVADTDNHRVRRITTGTGQITTVAGNGIEGFGGDGGLATAAAIDSPNGLAIDGAGNLFLADTHNGRVREVNAATGLISTVAGAATQAYGGDGGAAKVAGLALPRGLTIDAAGNLYVADSANHRIRRISAAGTITTIAGEGTEAFAGDGTPAASASLDSPRAVAVSPAGLVTLADSGNQRLRQIDALPTPTIHTIAGSGSTAPLGTLSLSGPSVVTYGGSTLTATLTATTLATEVITFLDTVGGPVVLGTAPLDATGTATFSTGSLAAGAHLLIAVYGGDTSHGPAQSSILALTVTPRALTATANPMSILYGQAIPALSGSLGGVLPQDAGSVSVAFSTTAVALAPVGAYPINATLIGSAATNYSVATSPVSLSITKAPSSVGVSVPTNNPSLGSPVTLTLQALSSTSGVPTGSVTLLDGGATLSVLPLSNGGAAFSTSTLGLGTHVLSAMYSGDANFLPGTSATTNVTVDTAPDFTLVATGAASQTIPAGSSATFHFSIAAIGPALTGPITLAVQGVPRGATASLSQSYVPPGGGPTSFTLTIQTPLAARKGPNMPPPGDFGSQAWEGRTAAACLHYGRIKNEYPANVFQPHDLKSE